MYDVCLIGAGICGCFLAHRLAHYHLDVLWLEQAADVGEGATLANSAIIHSGHDPKPGTQKARFNLRGSAMYEDLCRSLQVGFRRTSAFVAAAGPGEEETLMQLFAQARDRQIPALLLSGEEARKKEPCLSPAVTRVMELPSTGIITPWEVACALAEEAVLNGVTLHLNRRVTSITSCPDGFIIGTDLPPIKARLVINAAGIHADELTRMVWPQSPLTIRPRRGQYFVLDRQTPPLTARVIYPVPSERGKGVLAVPTLHDNLLIGPDSQFIDEKDDTGTTAAELAFVQREIAKTVRDVPLNQVIRTFSGLRAAGDTGDFVVEEVPAVPGFFQAAAIDSPGLTSAPAIAEYLVEELMKDAFDHTPKDAFLHRRPPLALSGLLPEERNAYIETHPEAGRIVCRCEQISEAEVRDVIRRPVGARSVKGVKKRARPGMGRCQGGFCEPLILRLLAEELGIAPEEVCYDAPGSELLLYDRNKEGMR